MRRISKRPAQAQIHRRKRFHIKSDTEWTLMGSLQQLTRLAGRDDLFAFIHSDAIFVTVSLCVVRNP